MRPSAPEQAFLGHAVGVEVLRRTQACLGARQIAVMPLKGIWLQGAVYDSPSGRPITDVDILVPDGSFEAALHCLVGEGFQVYARSRSEVALRVPGLPLPLDLHASLFTRSAFRMPTADLFVRARPEASLYGIPLHLPDPLDVYGHLVGHFLRSRASSRNTRHLGDFRALAARFQLDPGTCAAHLVACGLQRAARYSLGVASRQGDTFASRVLASLPADPLGAALGAWVRRALDSDAPAGPAAAAHTYLLEPTLARGLRALVARATDRALDA